MDWRTPLAASPAGQLGRGRLFIVGQPGTAFVIMLLRRLSQGSA